MITLQHARRRPRRGFTLVELMVVCIMVGMLASIALPKFEEYRKASVESTIQVDLRHAMSAQEGYLAKNGSYWTGGNWNGGALSPNPLDLMLTEQNRLNTYYSAAEGGHVVWVGSPRLNRACSQVMPTKVTEPGRAFACIDYTMP